MKRYNKAILGGLTVIITGAIVAGLNYIGMEIGEGEAVFITSIATTIAVYAVKNAEAVVNQTIVEYIDNANIENATIEQVNQE